MTSEQIRVRFAPSPTGFLHVGGLRTALYNHLFARRHGGTTVLRIEDTDRTRFVEGAVDNLLRTLEWAGITFDEGPVTGGPYGPYVQSERTALYRSHALRLLEDGKAYRCFCTQLELDTSRQQQAEKKQDPAYDRRCRTLSAEEIAAKLGANLPFTIRLKVPLVGTRQFTDLVRGDISVHYDVIDDQVLMKSDGFPTYHLANVVDDHLMKITHVIRGEEWLPSTTKHMLLYESFGWEPPRFAHLPLLLNADRSKLSKRQGDVAVEDFKEKGFLPQALINFVALLGWNPGDERELFTLGELCQVFGIDRVSKAGAVFDFEKLRWFNSQYLHALPKERLLELCTPYLTAAGIDTADTARCGAIIGLLANYLTVPADITPLLRPFTLNDIEAGSDEARAVLATEQTPIVLKAFLRHSRELATWNTADIKAMNSMIQQETGIKGKLLFMPIRFALTGEGHGPDLGATAEILGRDICMARVSALLR